MEGFNKLSILGLLALMVAAFAELETGNGALERTLPDDEETMNDLLEQMEQGGQYELPEDLQTHLANYLAKRNHHFSDINNNKRFSEFLGGKKKRFSEFLGGKKRFSEFLGGKKRFSEFLGGKKRFSENRAPEFLGANPHHFSDISTNKRFSEFLGGKKRFSEFLGGKKRFSEFLGGKKRFSEFIGGKRDARSVDEMMKRDLDFLGGR